MSEAMPVIPSAIYLLCAKFQLVIWSVLNNRYDALVGPTLALVKYVVTGMVGRRPQKRNGANRPR